MNGYGGSNDEDWLISPSIDMDAQDHEHFLFDYNDYYDGDFIELYYSSDSISLIIHQSVQFCFQWSTIEPSLNLQIHSAIVLTFYMDVVQPVPFC